MAIKLQGTNSVAAPGLTSDGNDGVVVGSSQLDFSIGGASKATLTSAGRLGVNTTSPAHLFQVADGTTAIGFSRDANNPEIIFDSNNLASASMIKASESAGGGFIEFFTKNTSGTLKNRCSIDTNGIMNLRGYESSFGDQTNHHCIQNNKSTSWAFQAVNTASYGYGVEIRVNSDTASREALYVYSTAATQSKATILSSGSFQSRSNSYGALSDIKLKENIIDASSQWNDIKAVKIRNFNFISDSSNTKLLGVVAQELETVCPNLIETCTDKEIDENGDRVETGTTTKSVKYSVLYMKAIKALQEAQSRIETLETKVAALEAG